MPSTISMAVVQSRIESDIGTNGRHIRELLQAAAEAGAQLALFPEGALSGYCKAQISDWRTVNWSALEREVDAISATARRLGLVAVVGSAHRSGLPRPFNSVHVQPLGLRYDKRCLSITEINDWYTPGFEPLSAWIGDYRFGHTICIEANFPELYMAYEGMDTDCVLHATYGLGPMSDVMLAGHAAANCLWIAVATAANADHSPSGIVGPDGRWLARCGQGVDLAVTTLDRADPRFDIALNKARPWRRLARHGQIYRDAIRQPGT